MDLGIDVLFFTIKAAIVIYLIYWFFSSQHDKHLKNKYDVALLSNQSKPDPQVTELRVQAYERLTLMCDRVSLPKLIRRIKVDGMSAKDFKMALYIAIAQEYEHNTTQQIYLSEKLWQILSLSRNQIMTIIEESESELDDDASAYDLEVAIYDRVGELATEPAIVAKTAVTTEARAILRIA